MSPYPFSPKQLLPLELFIIGMPSVILAIQPNSSLIKGDFIPEVLKKALPNGLLMLFNMLVIIALANFNFINAGEYQTVSTMVLIGTGFINLLYLCTPLNLLRTICVGISGLACLIWTATLGRHFGIVEVTFKTMFIFAVLVGISIPLHHFLPKLSDLIYDKLRVANEHRKVKKQKRKEERAKKKRIRKGEIILKDFDEE